MHRGHLVAERASPVVENFSKQLVVGDGQGEVEVGQAISAPYFYRAGRASSYTLFPYTTLFRSFTSWFVRCQRSRRKFRAAQSAARSGSGTRAARTRAVS